MPARKIVMNGTDCFSAYIRVLPQMCNGMFTSTSITWHRLCFFHVANWVMWFLVLSLGCGPWGGAVPGYFSHRPNHAALGPSRSLQGWWQMLHYGERGKKHQCFFFSFAPSQNGLINFEKRRKEFEVLVKVSLFQKSAANYSFAVNHRLEEWLYHFHVYSEQEGYVNECSSHYGCGLMM